MTKSFNTLIILFVLAMIAIGFTSCSEASGDYTNRPALTPIVRAKMLEGGNFITYVVLDTYQKATLRPLDTVWVNLDTHHIDDTCTTAMACVLYANP